VLVAVVGVWGTKVPSSIEISEMTKVKRMREWMY